MTMETFKRLPKHIGIIPDGNRRWATSHGMQKQEGYIHGVGPGLDLYEDCLKLGVEEITLYGFTMDNVKRPSLQARAFQKACVDSVRELQKRDADLLVVGNTNSKVFPEELKLFTTRTKFGEGKIKVNFLVNYGWDWDLNQALQDERTMTSKKVAPNIASKDISRIDLIIRWGGRRRLSGFLPIQSVYSDFYVLDEYWPEYQEEHLLKALRWYQSQDVTLGG